MAWLYFITHTPGHTYKITVLRHRRFSSRFLEYQKKAHLKPIQTSSMIHFRQHFQFSSFGIYAQTRPSIQHTHKKDQIAPFYVNDAYTKLIVQSNLMFECTACVYLYIFVYAKLNAVNGKPIYWNNNLRKLK